MSRTRSASRWRRLLAGLACFAVIVAAVVAHRQAREGDEPRVVGGPGKP
ncbi:MAG: hypothetical protein JWM47_3140, partial [Acidimicrobiales bacterium]|nr:hypothetical protein [Acidimicrobiales bacterium]